MRRFISQLTFTCGPIHKLLKKNYAGKWDEACQKAFDKIKEGIPKVVRGLLSSPEPISYPLVLLELNSIDPLPLVDPNPAMLDLM